ncbi:hypothetical protein Droror1_Dr00000018 [Drosera rotundifolia]
MSYESGIEVAVTRDSLPVLVERLISSLTAFESLTAPPPPPRHNLHRAATTTASPSALPSSFPLEVEKKSLGRRRRLMLLIYMAGELELFEQCDLCSRTDTFDSRKPEELWEYSAGESQANFCQAWRGVRLWKQMVEEMYKEKFGEGDINFKSCPKSTPKGAPEKSWASQDKSEDQSDTSMATTDHQPS